MPVSEKNSTAKRSRALRRLTNVTNNSKTSSVRKLSKKELAEITGSPLLPIEYVKELVRLQNGRLFLQEYFKIAKRKQANEFTINKNILSIEKEKVSVVKLAVEIRGLSVKIRASSRNLFIIALTAISIVGMIVGTPLSVIFKLSILPIAFYLLLLINPREALKAAWRGIKKLFHRSDSRPADKSDQS